VVLVRVVRVVFRVEVEMGLSFAFLLLGLLALGLVWLLEEVVFHGGCLVCLVYSAFFLRV